MRPTKDRRSNLRFPLDEILGSPASVRLLRVLLYEVAGPVSVSDAAQKAGLSRVGARNALECLERSGIVVRVGTGRAQKFGPKEHTPYSALLRRLFEEEQMQYEDLLRQLRQVLAIPEVVEAWIGTLPAEPGQALEIDVVADVEAAGWIGAELRTRMIETEKRFDLIVELETFTKADRPGFPEGAILLAGTGGGTKMPRPPGAKTIAESDERSLRMARGITELIKSDPALIRRALHHLNRLLHEGQGTANGDLGEWRQLIETYSPERLRELLVSKSSRAERLRRSSPFFAVLTPDERDRVVRDVEGAGR